MIDVKDLKNAKRMVKTLSKSSQSILLAYTIIQKAWSFTRILLDESADMSIMMTLLNMMPENIKISVLKKLKIPYHMSIQNAKKISWNL